MDALRTIEEGVLVGVEFPNDVDIQSCSPAVVDNPDQVFSSAALGEHKQPEIAAMIMAYNAEAFPASANARDSYGEVLMALKQPKLAKAQFEQALTLGKAAGASPRALEGFSKNLAAAEKALAASK